MNDEDKREEGAAAPEEKPPVSGALPLAAAIGTRNLMIIIVTMPLVFLVVLLVTLMVFGKPGAREAASAASAVRSTPIAETALEQPPTGGAAGPVFAGAAAPLVLPAGGAVGAMALDGDRLAVRIDGPDGGEIVVYDLAQGVELRRIRVVEADNGL